MRLSHAAAAIGVFLLCSTVFGLGDGKLHMYFVDCGQGDAILIIGPEGTSVLVDGGPSNTVTPITEAMNDAIAAGLTDNKLDYVVCTHMHADHLAGLEVVAAQFAGGLVYAYDRTGSYSSTAFTEYDTYFGASGLNKRRMAEDFSIGTNCLMNYVGHPTAGTGDENNNGVLYRLEFKNFRCSLAGDLGGTYEISFASSVGDVDFYKANHHGSRTSSQQGFLDVIQPQTHVFSYAVGNSYGHPHAESVARLDAMGSVRYDTPLDHASAGPYVELVTDGNASYSINGTSYGLSGGTPTPPAAPSGLAATAISSSQINLTWTDNSSNEDSFVLARATTSGGPYTDIATLGANTTSYSNTGLAISTTYYYVVRATNAGGASANSNQASATTQAAGTTIVTFTSVSGDDGWVLESSETSNVGGSINSSNTTILVGDDKQRKQYKGVLSFDTSSLPDTATIQRATVKVTQSTVSSTPWSTLGTLAVDIKSPNFGAATTLATDDFAAAAGASSVATIPKPSGNGVQVSANLSSTGISNVNKAGKTQLRLRFTTDDDNDSTADNFVLYSGNDSTASRRPVLEIEYAQ
jgi:beta-lactamase superfamily II metal-dependent hydrolase